MAMVVAAAAAVVAGLAKATGEPIGTEQLSKDLTVGSSLDGTHAQCIPLQPRQNYFPRRPCPSCGNSCFGWRNAWCASKCRVPLD